MRKSRVIAFVVASVVSSASLVHAQSAALGARAAGREMRGGMHGEQGRGGVLRGVTLGDAERTRLRTIHAKYAGERRSLRQSLQPAIQEARAARQKGDTAAARAVWERNKGGRDQLVALRAREEADIRGALAPENQKLFDANLAQRTRGRADWMEHGERKGGHAGHGGAPNR